MSKSASKRVSSRPITLQSVLRDTYPPLSEYLKETLYQATHKAKQSAVLSRQGQLTEQTTEIESVQRGIVETREKIKRVKLEREQVLGEREKLKRELDRSMQQKDLTSLKKFNGSLESAIFKLKGETAHLKAFIENMQDELGSKRNLLQMRENEVKLMAKELEKANKQKSILVDKAKMGSGGVKMPVKAMGTKSQMESFWKESLTKGIQKETIRPFNSFGFALNMHQSSGPIKVPSGLNTSRSSNPKDPEPPSTRRKTPVPESKPSSPSVE